MRNPFTPHRSLQVWNRAWRTMATVVALAASIALIQQIVEARDPLPDPAVYHRSSGAAAPLPPASQPADNEGVVYQIPRLANIVVDGQAADWGERGFAVDVLANTAEHVRSRADFDGCFRLGWNARGLLVLVNVTDAVDQESNDPAAGGDSTEFLISPRGKVKDPSNSGLRIVIGPGVGTEFTSLRIHAIKICDGERFKKGLPIADVEPGIVAARTKTANGYLLEALVPWEDLNLSPAPGLEFALQLKVNDVDGPRLGSQLLWNPGNTRSCDPRSAYRLRLSENPSPPIHAAAYADYVRQHRVRVCVRATAEFDGKTISIHQRGRVLKTGVLRSDFVQADRVSATLSLPMPPADQPYGSLDVWVDDKPLTTVTLPPPPDSSKWVLPYEELVFKPCVFSGAGFPQPDFEEPDQVEDIIGAYDLRTTYYDAQYHVVERADRPGRYGAVVEIRGADGKVFTRYRTLFREPEEVSWRNVDLPMDVKLPPQLGIDPAVLRRQNASVSQYFKNLLGDGLTFETNTAVLLAGLYESAHDDDHPRQGPWARDQKWWAGLKSIRGELVPTHLIYLPADYAQAKAREPNKRWPLIVFLHGKGERGDNLDMVRWAGLAGVFEMNRDLPFIMAAPQCPCEDFWSPWAINALVDKLQTEYAIDADRIYLTGMSMGGYGVWATAAEFPNRFAAIAPICGGGEPADATRLTRIPTWAFHGENDDIVPIRENQRMVDAITQAGGNARLTIIPHTGHNAWDKVYYGDDLLKWFLEHKRTTQPDVPDR